MPKYPWKLLAITFAVAIIGGFFLRTTPPAKVAPKGMKIIRPRFPNPIFLSGPWGCTLPNIEYPPSPPIKEFSALLETEIISIAKPVTSSSPPIHGELAWINDDEAFPGDAGENEVWFNQLPCWVQIDLGSERIIDHVWFWHGQGTLSRRQTPELFEEVILQVSNDKDFQHEVTTLFNSDDDGSSGQGKGTDPTYMETNHGRCIAASGSKARYVRLWGGKAYSGGPCRFTEIIVWGR